jgi:hypothetical protein
LAAHSFVLTGPKPGDIPDHSYTRSLKYKSEKTVKAQIAGFHAGFPPDILQNTACILQMSFQFRRQSSIRKLLRANTFREPQILGDLPAKIVLLAGWQLAADWQFRIPRRSLAAARAFKPGASSSNSSWPK